MSDMQIFEVDTEDQCRNAGGVNLGKGSFAGYRVPGTMQQPFYKIKCGVLIKQSAIQNIPTSINVNPVIQTTVSPQVSPVFQQQFQPQNSPATAGTVQTSAPPATAAPPAPVYTPGQVQSQSAPTLAPPVASAPPPAFVPSSVPTAPSPYPVPGYTAPDASLEDAPQIAQPVQTAQGIDWKIPALLAGALMLGLSLSDRKAR